MTDTNQDPRVGTRWNDLEAPRDTMLAQINIYNDSVTVTTHGHKSHRTHFVHPNDIAHALQGRVTYTSPVLDGKAIWWSAGREGQVLGLWEEPAKRRLAMQRRAFEPPERFDIPLPGLVFACTPGRPPRVFAAKERPTSPDAALYRSPTFNTFDDGRVCPGSHSFPTDPRKAPESFFLSYFSMTGHTTNRSAKYPNDLYQLWQELRELDEYPLDDLIYQTTLGEAMGAHHR